MWGGGGGRGGHSTRALRWPWRACFDSIRFATIMQTRIYMNEGNATLVRHGNKEDMEVKSAAGVSDSAAASSQENASGLVGGCGSRENPHRQYQMSEALETRPSPTTLLAPRYKFAARSLARWHNATVARGRVHARRFPQCLGHLAVSVGLGIGTNSSSRNSATISSVWWGGGG